MANFPLGERHHSSRLTRDEVIEIRKSADRGTDLARRFGVSSGAIYKILDGRSWKHVR